MLDGNEILWNLQDNISGYAKVYMYMYLQINFQEDMTVILENSKIRVFHKILKRVKHF